MHICTKELRFKPKFPVSVLISSQVVDTNASHQGTDKIFYCVRPSGTLWEPFCRLIVAIKKPELHRLQLRKQLFDSNHPSVFSKETR